MVYIRPVENGGIDRTAGASPLIGARVGNYEVVRLLGHGGMGEVYLARHPDLGREVAVKVLGGGASADAMAIGRFRQEALAAARIGHRAIVEIQDIGTLPDGRHYYVMERLQGQSLRELLEARGPLSPVETGELVRPVIDALTAAHAAGIVHRDLKPDNIFLSQAPGSPREVKVLDFGIAKLVDASLAPLVATRSGALIGTPLYMSPEQAAGTGRDVGPASDVYGLGAVIFHMLTGRPPFLGEGVGEVLVQHMQSPPPSVRDHRPDLPEALDRVIAQALAKAPGDRFETMQAFGAALEHALATVGADSSITGGPTMQAAAAAPAPLEATEVLDPGTAPPITAADPAPQLSQSSLSEAAAERVTAPRAAPPKPGHRGLMIGVIVGLAVGAGAVALGIVLGRGSDSKPAPGPRPGATAARAPSGPDATVTKRPPASRPSATDAAAPRAVAPTAMKPPTETGMDASPRADAHPIPKPREVRARPRTRPSPRPLPMAGMKPTGIQVSLAKRWLQKAAQGERRGQHFLAGTLAKMSYRYLETTQAVRIIGFSACRRRFAKDARWAYARLPTSLKRRQRALCKRSGISLP